MMIMNRFITIKQLQKATCNAPPASGAEISVRPAHSLPIKLDILWTD